MIDLRQAIKLLALCCACYAGAAQGKESAITHSTAFVTRGEPVNIEAIAINEALSPAKPLTLLVWQRANRRWVSVGSSHSTRESSFAEVNGDKVFFTFPDTQSLDPGATYFGTSRSCTANGICPLDVEPDAAVRVMIAY